MKTNKFELDKIMAIVELKSELEVEQASSLASRFRWMQKENESLKPLRSHLLELVEEYENKHWTDIDLITDEQIKESDNAELIVEQQNILRFRESLRS
jgi:hypothetical protein